MPRDYYLDLVSAKVYPAEDPYATGILTRDGKSLPFVLERGWSGPGGHYLEQWSIRRTGTDVLFESEPKRVFVRGPQAVTRHSDLVEGPVELEPGTYQIAFIVEGRFMGSTAVEVREADQAAA